MQTVADPVYRESQKWLSERCVDFDYSNDARFESFRDFRKNKQLFQYHNDIAKDYDKKARFYRSCQKWQCSEWNRQIQNTQERFSKLIGRTYASSQTKSSVLQYSYNKWVVHGKPSRDNETGLTAIQAVEACNNEADDEHEDQQIHRNSEDIDAKTDERIRSVSVDNFMTLEHKDRDVNSIVGGRDSRGSRSVQHFHQTLSFTRSPTDLKIPRSGLVTIRQKIK